MDNDRRCFLVVEESLPEGTIAEHRRSRPKAKRHVRTRRWRLRKRSARHQLKETA